MSSLKGTEVARILKVNRRVGLLLREGREGMGLKPKHLARLFNIAQKDILRWESGFGTLPAPLFAAIASRFNQDVQMKLQFLITAFRIEREELVSGSSLIEVRRENFEALGVASGFLLAC